MKVPQWAGPIPMDLRVDWDPELCVSGRATILITS